MARTGTRLKDGSVVSDPRLGRILQSDIRSRNFRISAIIDVAAPLRSYTWSVGFSKVNQYHLDQGNEGTCVQYGFSHELLARPVLVKFDTVSNLIKNNALYFQFQQNDEWPGGAYPGAVPFYEGTSVLAGAKVLTSLSFYLSYHWADTEQEIASAIAYHGPVVLGINWYTGMFKPDINGYIKPTGSLAGGHCILAKGINLKEDCYILHNSWGPGWGINGCAKIKRSAMSRLISEQGEACLPIRSRLR